MIWFDEKKDETQDTITWWAGLRLHLHLEPASECGRQKPQPQSAGRLRTANVPPTPASFSGSALALFHCVQPLQAGRWARWSSGGPGSWSLCKPVSLLPSQPGCLAGSRRPSEELLCKGAQGLSVKVMARMLLFFFPCLLSGCCMRAPGRLQAGGVGVPGTDSVPRYTGL